MEWILYGYRRLLYGIFAKIWSSVVWFILARIPVLQKLIDFVYQTFWPVLSESRMWFIRVKSLCRAYTLWILQVSVMQVIWFGDHWAFIKFCGHALIYYIFKPICVISLRSLLNIGHGKLFLVLEWKVSCLTLRKFWSQSFWCGANRESWVLIHRYLRRLFCPLTK